MSKILQALIRKLRTTTTMMRTTTVTMTLKGPVPSDPLTVELLLILPRMTRTLSSASTKELVFGDAPISVNNM
jgi:hypothetical protein